MRELDRALVGHGRIVMPCTGIDFVPGTVVLDTAIDCVEMGFDCYTHQG